MIPDTIRPVTIAAADDLETVAFTKELTLCPRGTTSITVQSVPAVVTPTEPTTSTETVAPIIVYGTFNIKRSN